MTLLDLFISAIVLGAILFLIVAFDHEYNARKREREQAKRARQDIIKANPVNRLDVRV